MNIKDKVVGLLFIDSSPTEKQSALVDNIIELTTLKLLSRLPLDIISVPTELEYVVVEVSVIRFNRIGSEGMKSEGVEGHSMAFIDDDFKAFQSDIDRWLDSQNEVSKKLVRFL